jgi:hypothetical protein
MQSEDWYKKEETDQIWWLDNREQEGIFAFSFDRIEIFYMYQDYPWKLTKEQKEIFDRENPFWAEYFKERVEDG